MDAKRQKAHHSAEVEPVKHSVKVSGLRGWSYNDPWEGEPASRYSQELLVDCFTFKVTQVL